MSIKYIRIASDTHLEQFYGRNVASLVVDILPTDNRDSESVLVLAGDISSKPNQLVEFIHGVESRFARVVYVNGNHEPYRQDIKIWEKNTRDLMELHLKNTSYALNEVKCEQIDGVRFIFSTMWADGGRDSTEMDLVECSLNDFRVIAKDGTIFTVADMQSMHRSMRADIETFLKDTSSGMKNVVVTHHMPSYRLCHPRFGDYINGGVAANCDAILSSDYAPALWINGHTHDRISTKLWNTRIECNPSGYRGEYNNGYSSTGPVFIDISTLEVHV